MVDTAGTISSLSTRLKEAGARNVYVAASHGVLNDHSIEVIEKSDVKKIFVSNTLPLPKRKSDKVAQVSVAPQLAHVILTEHFRAIDFQEEKFTADE